MSSSSFGKHASGATSGQPAVPEPSFAERARTLMHSGRIGKRSSCGVPRQQAFEISGPAHPQRFSGGLGAAGGNRFKQPGHSGDATRPRAAGKSLYRFPESVPC
jgi:hypothetical protein